MKPRLRIFVVPYHTLKPLQFLHRAIGLRSMCSSAIATECSHEATQSIAFLHAKPYDEVPGPRPIPILGNAWRLLPLIGQYQISDVGKISQMFYDEYGKIVRLGGLMGRPDLLFVYDADEIEKVYRQEGPTPFRPAMPCLVHYKSVVRKDFFGELPGVVGV